MHNEDGQFEGDHDTDMQDAFDEVSGENLDFIFSMSSFFGSETWGPMKWTCSDTEGKIKLSCSHT